MSYLQKALSLILQLVFSAATGLFVLRILAEASRVDFHHPLSQGLYRYTNPAIALLRRWLPNWRRINLAALLIAWLLTLAGDYLQLTLAGLLPRLIGLPWLGLANLLDFVLMLYVVLILIWTLSSFLASSRPQPALYFLAGLVDPLLRPWRGRMMIGGLDFSPTAALLALMLARILIAAPLHDYGLRLCLQR